MDAPGAVILAMLLCVATVLVLWWCWKLISVEKAKQQWPKTEATVQTGGLGAVASSRGAVVRLPAFAFSYHVSGEYYSGRFALMPYTIEYDDSIINRMIGQKLLVCYDPAHP